ADTHPDLGRLRVRARADPGTHEQRREHFRFGHRPPPPDNAQTAGRPAHDRSRSTTRRPGGCAARLRRAPADCRRVHAARAPGADAAGDGARPRGVSAVGVGRHAVARQAPFRRHRGARDPAVRDEALSLLASHSRAGAFLERPIAESAPDLLADDEPLAAGTTIGAYTIVREIGRGGMGHVYLASDARLGRSVALKALAPHLVRDPTHRERLRREARAAASLSHPGICTVFALEEVEGALYIATEFVDGRTLREEIDAG